MKLNGSILTVFVSIAFGSQVFPANGQAFFVTGVSENEATFSGYAQPIVGYDFMPNVSITVGALGAYDHHFDGLERANQVGLWNRATQTLLASVTVPSGSVSPLQSGYRWVSISPIILTPGVTYTVASWNSGFEAIGVDVASSLMVDPRISLGAGYVDAQIAGLQMPTRQGGPGAIFIGPGFATPVPEPAISLLLVFGAGLACSLRCRKTGRE